jgi:hypothetical protein
MERDELFMKHEFFTGILDTFLLNCFAMPNVKLGRKMLISKLPLTTPQEKLHYENLIFVPVGVIFPQAKITSCTRC